MLYWFVFSVYCLWPLVSSQIYLYDMQPFTSPRLQFNCLRYGNRQRCDVTLAVEYCLRLFNENENLNL